jgi:hypothetical protein
VLGNEAADELAKLTAQGQVPTGVTCMQVHAGSAPYHDLFWPAMAPDAAHPAPQYLRNLNEAVKQVAMPGNATGGANKGIYVQLWAATARHAQAEASNHMWTATSVTHGARRATLQARFGVLYNAKIAARMNQPYLPCPTPATAAGMCPLCRAPDSIGHILGGCGHPSMRALYIQRHDQACRILVKAIRRGRLGGYYMLADAGTTATLQPLGVTDKRIPGWLLPTAPSRPDILIVHANPAALAHTQPAGRGRKRSAAPMQHAARITIIELTCQCDHTAPGATPHGREQPKERQHAATQAALEARGHTVDYYVVALGRMGTIYKATKTTVAALGIAQPQPLLQKLHVHTVQSLHTIVQARRRLERVRVPEQQRPP